MNTNEFLYKIGDTCVLTGLVEFPELNGTVVKISGYRPCDKTIYCESGRAYYLEQTLDWDLDWVFEERLRPVYSEYGKEKLEIPSIVKRRPLDDDRPDEYLESDNDFVLNNFDACVWFLEHRDELEDLCKYVESSK